MRLAYLCLLAITAAYVSFEIPFAARLVDVMSSPVDAERLHRYEVAGRWLSGVAVGLAIASFLILRRPRAARVISAAFLGAIAAICVYFGERQFVDAHTAGASRPAAQLQGLVLRAMLIDPDIATGEVAAVAQDLRQSPEGRAAIAMSARVGSFMPTSVYEGFDAKAYFARRIEPFRPDAKAFREIAIPGAQDAAERVWATYRSADEGRRDAIAQARRDFDRRWTTMTERFARNYGADKMRRCDIGIMGRSKMRREIMLAGVETPENWNICDRRYVERKALSATLAKIEERWRSGPIQIEPGIADRRHFLRHPEVRRILAESGVPIIDGAVVDASLRDSDIERRAIPASLETQAILLQRRFDPVTGEEPRARTLPPSPDGPAVAAVQRAAAEAAIVPLLAIALSIAGAIYHLAKVSGLAVGALAPRSRWLPKLTFVGALSLMACSPLLRDLPAPVTETFSRVSVAPGLSSDLATARWLVGAAGMLYEAGQAVEKYGPFRLLDAYLEGEASAPLMNAALRT